MSNVIERLEALAADPHVVQPMSWAGFNLVTENGWTRDYVVAGLNALPDLLKLARAVAELPSSEPTNLREWNQAVREFNALKAAFEPLLREAQS